MPNVKKVQQLILTTEDSPGMLAEVTGTIAAQKINIEAICAYGMEGKAIFYLITNDNAKAKSALSKPGWQIKEEEVVILDLENKPGSLKQVSDKLKAKNINLLYCYGSACAMSCPCRFIMKAENNNAVIEALK